jgi:hypothetical protein
VKPTDTLDDAIAALAKVRTCEQLNALHNSDDKTIGDAECKGFIPSLEGLRPTAKDDLGPVGVADFVAKNGNGTALFVEDAKDGHLRFSTVIANEAGAVHPAVGKNDAAQNMAAAITALRAGDGAAFHRVISENSSLYTEPVASVAKLKNPTGSGPRLVSDLKADRAAKPQPLGVDTTFGLFALRANGHDYVLIELKGPTGYKYQGFYPQPAG